MAVYERTYKRYTGALTPQWTRLFVLPSPSGAARRYWDESWWHALARLVA